MSAEDAPRAVLRETDAEAIRLAKTLIRSARHGALAVLSAEGGAPAVSRVGVSTDFDGVPVILTSALAPHTAALRADPRCALLLGAPGRGDAMALARISIPSRAVAVAHGSEEEARVAARYLSHQPKAAAYAELADFGYFRLEPTGASLNGGFARAYALEAGDLVTEAPGGLAIAAAEMAAVAHMNADHADSVRAYAVHFAKAPDGPWVLTGIDAEGIDLALGPESLRIFFEEPLAGPEEIRPALVRMAREARPEAGPS